MRINKLLVLLVTMIASCVLVLGSGQIFAEEFPPLKGKDLAPVTDEPVYFRAWSYMTHIPKENVEKYNAELGGNVDFAIITGDWPSMVEAKFIAKAPIDFLYGTPQQASRWYDGGWILPIDSMPNAEEIKADIYPNILDAWTYKGKLLGLSYFCSTLGVVHVNLKKTEELGITPEDYPKTWHELYDKLYEIRDKGLEKPFLPYWFAEYFGMNWAFTWEVLNRGGFVAHPETHEPMVTVDGPAGDTLRDWKRIWNDGLVPEEVLTMRQVDYYEAWGSGEYVYSPHCLYDLKRYNDPHYSKIAGYVSVLPYQGQTWGFLDTGLYLLGDRPRSEAHTRDVTAFMTWYGYKDHNGEPAVHMKWLEEAGLFSAYKSVMESPEAESLIRDMTVRAEDYDVVLDLYKRSPYPMGSFGVVWGSEFNTWLKDYLQVFVTEDKPVDETVLAIRDKINQLNKQYGIR